MLFLPSLITLSALAAPLPDHPVLDKILERYDGKQVSQACSTLVENEFKTIASVEKFEAAVILKNLKKEGCQLDFLAVGGRDFVNRDLGLYEKLLSDPNAASAIDLHTHPLLNVDFFRAGNPYAGEIMFAEQAAIDGAALPAELFDNLVLLTKDGKIPGFNLSPPSIQDMLAATAESSIPLKYTVVTSAGFWEFTVSKTKPLSEIRAQIDDFKVYSFMYDTAHSNDPKVKPAQKERAQKLFDANMQNPENRRIMLEWQACSFGLRRPFSQQALAEFAQGKEGKVLAEFQEKLDFSRRWSTLMKEIGFELQFQPFSH